MAIQATVTITNGAIAVAPDPLPAGKTANQVLEWTITTPGWTFPDNGIVVNSDPGGQFSNPGATGNGRKFTLHDKNTDSNRYKYTVNVTNGSQNLNQDPIIVNEG